MGRNKKRIKIGFIVIFILIFIYLITRINIFNKDNLLEIVIRSEEDINSGMFFTAFITILMVFFIPISWFSALGAFCFGLKGYIYVIIGGLVSAIIAFYISKIFRKDVIKIINKIYYRKERDLSLKEISDQIEAYGMGYVFFLRSMPFIPFSIANYVAGLTSIPLKDYILGTILGIAPGQFITTYFFTKAINLKGNPIKIILAVIAKGAYVFTVIKWQRKSRYKTKE